MQAVKNQNQTPIMISAVLLILALISVLLGLAVFDGDLGFWCWAMGGFAAFVAVILLMVFVYDGKKKARAIEALLSGEGLLARWQYSRDEWDRYSRNERDRAVADARKTSFWTFLILVGISLAAGLFSDMGMDRTFFLVVAVTAIGVTALVWGSMFASASLTYRRNCAGVGETYISRSGVYFHGRYYTWAVSGSRLTAVEFEPGEPATVAFRYETTAGDSTNAVVNRVPVPLGYEEAAQSVVSSFYEGA